MTYLLQDSQYSQSKGRIEPYEEVHFSSSSVYVELNREQPDRTVHHNFQTELFKNYSGNKDTVDDGWYEDVKISSPSVYAEPYNRNTEDEGSDDKNYRKLLKKYDALYEETGNLKSPPSYTELNNTTRKQQDDALYQKLIKK